MPEMARNLSCRLILGSSNNVLPQERGSRRLLELQGLPSLALQELSAVKDMAVE